MVTEAPAGAEAGFKLVMLGGTVTVKVMPLLARLPTVTMTFPVVAPVGTGTVMLVGFQFVGVAGVPLKLTVLVPCVAPKLFPKMFIEVPTGPEVGETLVRLGPAVTVKTTP